MYGVAINLFCNLYNRFVATLASKDLVDRDSVNIFKFDEYFHLNQTQVNIATYDHLYFYNYIMGYCGDQLVFVRYIIG